MKNLETEPLKLVPFWKQEMKKAGVLDKLMFFNDITVEQRAPDPNSGYKLILKDVVLDGKKTDIYHTDTEEDEHWHRIFLHQKK